MLAPEAITQVHTHHISREGTPLVDAHTGAKDLAGKYGVKMTYEQVADELKLSALYVKKKIGSRGHQHLEWVQALKPARFREGRYYYFKTNVVTTFLAARG